MLRAVLPLQQSLVTREVTFIPCSRIISSAFGISETKTTASVICGMSHTHAIENFGTISFSLFPPLPILQLRRNKMSYSYTVVMKDAHFLMKMKSVLQAILSSMTVTVFQPPLVQDTSSPVSVALSEIFYCLWFCSDHSITLKHLFHLPQS